MKKVLKFLSLVVIIIAFVWMLKTKFDYEPIIVFITAIIGFALSSTSSSSNSEVNGEGNTVIQKKGDNLSNTSKIEGDNNKVIQL